ncbi:MAG: potassium-transporting ATPase subunit KdpB [Acidimicrobiia bacterium]|nr:potassium-transporting ATPase subunit KdpB [Acidimicrobiia bacterium]
MTEQTAQNTQDQGPETGPGGASREGTAIGERAAVHAQRTGRQRRAILDPEILWPAVTDSFRKLKPTTLIANPVIFIVEVVSVVTTLLFVRDVFLVGGDPLFVGLVSFWLWFTVLFANFAEAVAEGRGKAQADTLRATRKQTTATRRLPDGTLEQTTSTALEVGDVVVVAAGEVIPSDGDVIEGIASVDESAITGESAPVIREAGGDRSAVTGGTRVLSDAIVVQISARPGETFLDRMIALVEGAERQKTPNELALTILLSGLTLIFLLATATLQPFAIYSGATGDKVISLTILLALLVCLIPTTIGGLLSAIGIAGMDRLVQRNVLAMSGRAVEAAGDVSTLLLDKTGTITYGNRQAVELIPMYGISVERLAEVARMSSLADETPEGKSIVALAEGVYGARSQEVPEGSEFIPFSAQTRMSGVDFDASSIRKGAADSVRQWIDEQGGEIPAGMDQTIDSIARDGGTPLVVAEGREVLGVVHLKDVIKEGMVERFGELRAMGIRTVMITGDNPVTASAIAEEAGVDDYLAEATPEDKMRLIRREQEGGKLVAMTGDGTNDAPALAQADVGVAMNSGTQAAKEAANMVDLDSDPTKLIDVVEIGKQMLMTRGSLTTFSIANDIAKYFAIIPAMFVGVFPALDALNLMRLESPVSAILSAVVFNALVIILLIPLALRGVSFRALPAAQVLRRNLFVYGIGGIVAPFIGIKLIDVVITALGIS